MGPMTSPRWSLGGMSLMPVMSAPVWTAICRKEWAGFTLMPAARAAAMNAGVEKERLDEEMDSRPSMDPPEWERIFFSA